ncbi:MAG: gliding motility-associated C-terminal domain-containing protein [Cellulophaga sp.]
MKLSSLYNMLSKKIIFFGALLLACFSGYGQIATITATDATATELGTTTGEFTITLDAINATGSTIVVNYSIGVDAVNGTDYSTIGTSVSIANGVQSATVSIIPIDDVDVELDENVELTLSAGTGYTLGAPSSAIVVLSSDDVAPPIATISASDASAAELGTDPGEFTITLDAINTTGSAIVVNYSISTGAGNAINGTDYSSIVSSVSIANNSQSATVLITPIDDAEVESNENIELTLAIGTGYTPGAPSSAIVVVTDDDNCPTTAPVLNSAVSMNFCGTPFNQNLDAYSNSTPPVNTVLRWSTSSNTALTGQYLGGSNVTQEGTYYGFFYDALNNCASGTLQVILVANDSPTAGTTSDFAACNMVATGNITQVDLDDRITGQDGGTWAITTDPSGGLSIGAGNVVDFIGLADGNYVFTYTTNTAILPCVNDTVSVTISVTDCVKPCDAGNTAPALDTSVSMEFCDTISVSLNDYTNSTPPTAGSVVLTWSVLADPLDENGHRTISQVNNPAPGVYYGFFYDSVNKCASPTLEVSLVIRTTPSVDDTVSATRCGEGTVTLEATASGGGILNWYATIDGTEIIAIGTMFETPVISETTTYFVEAIVANCTSLRVLVTATVVAPPITGGNPNTINVCNDADNGVTEIDLDDSLTGADAGVWSTTSAAVIDGENKVNFEGLTDGAYVFTYTTTTAVSPCENIAIQLTVIAGSCIQDADNDGISDSNEATLGTNPNNDDSDGDGIKDLVEVGNDLSNPLDEDSDGVIDALDSNTVDADNDGVMDQQDPANENPCVPDNTHNLCDTDNDGITDGEEIANGSDPEDPCDPNRSSLACNPDPLDLSLEKLVDKSRAVSGDEIEFTIILKNEEKDIGEETKTTILNIIVEDRIVSSMGFEYISHTVSSGIYDQSSGDWLVDELQAEKSETLKIKVKVLNTGSYKNEVRLKESFPLDNTMENNTAEVSVVVGRKTEAKCGDLFNQFSPNGDGLNDSLIVNCQEEYLNIALQIYDRYGNEVFSAKNYDNTWKGTGENGNLPKGTYFYILDLGDGSEIVKGWIQIIR